MLAESVDAVIGVDNHTDTHTACLVDGTGREVAAVTFEASPDGYSELIAWAAHQAPGPRLIWAVEGCRSHGAGLLRALLAAGQHVVEAGRPQRVGRRPGGKSDPSDARLAACTTLAAGHHAQPRSDATGKHYASCSWPANTPTRPAPPRSTYSKHCC
nr:transposase [Micromonospora cremea]